MERIKLTRNEKAVLRLLAMFNKPQTVFFNECDFTVAVRRLAVKGFVKAELEEEKVIKASVTDYGKYYLAENPWLKNPIDWNGIIAFVSIVFSVTALLLTIVSLCINS